MNCEEFIGRLLELDDPSNASESEDIREHAESCSQCNARLELHTKVVTGFEFIAHRSAPPELASRISSIPASLQAEKAAIEQTEDETPGFFNIFWFKTGFAAGLACILAVFVYQSTFRVSMAPHETMAETGKIQQALAEEDKKLPDLKDDLAPNFDAPHDQILPPGQSEDSFEEFEVAQAEVSLIIKELGSSVDEAVEQTAVTKPEQLALALLPPTAEPLVDSSNESAGSVDSHEHGIMFSMVSDQDMESELVDSFDETRDEQYVPTVVGEPLVMAAPPPPPVRETTPIPASSRSASRKARAKTDDLTSQGSGFAPPPVIPRVGTAESSRGGTVAVAPVMARESFDVQKSKPPLVSSRKLRAELETVQDSRSARIESLVSQNMEFRREGPVDLNDLVLKNIITVRERIQLSPPAGKRWYLARSGDGWKVFLIDENN